MLRTVLIIGFLLNLAWELFQRPAYETKSSLYCFPAAVLDALFIGAVFGGMRMLFRRRAWLCDLKARVLLVVALGTGTAVVVEWLAQSNGWWYYNPTMPRTPLLNIGLFPVAQCAFIPVITFALAKRLAQNRIRCDGGS